MAIVGGGLDNVLSSLGVSRQFADQVSGSLRSGKADAAAMAQLLHTMYASLNLQQNTAGGGGTGIPEEGWVPGVRDYLARVLGEQGLPPIGNGFGGFSQENALGSSRLGRSLQMAMLSSPEMSRSLEKSLGGWLVPDGRNDGRFTVYRSPYTRTGALMKQAMVSGQVPRSAMTTALAKVNIPLVGHNLPGGSMGGLLKGLMGMEANIASMIKGFDKFGGANSALNKYAQATGVNPNSMNFEDLVGFQLFQYASATEQEIQKKVNALDKSMTAGQANGGFYGGLTDPTAAGQTGRELFGELEAQQTAGGVTGAQMGGGVQGGAESLLSGVGQGLPENPNEMSDTMKQQMLQKLMGDLQKMYEMLTNILKTMHDMQMGAIRNIRG